MSTAPSYSAAIRRMAERELAAKSRERKQIKLLSANIQAGSSTRRYTDYAVRSWSHVLPAGGKRQALDQIAELAGNHDIVGLQESDPGSWRSGFTNQTHYLAERGGFDYWTHQPKRAAQPLRADRGAGPPAPRPGAWARAPAGPLW